MASKLSKYRKMMKFRKLLKYRKIIENELRQLVPPETDGLRVYHPIRHMLNAGGKLLRPSLMLLTCEAVGGDPNKIVSGAGGAELGHVASLIHDDIIDGSNLRRGVVSVQEKFGVHDAVLSGDLLVFHAFRGVADTIESGIPADRVVRAIQLTARSGINLCIGQELEANCVGNLDITEEEYLKVITNKTGALVKAVCEIGAVLGGGDENAIKALSQYGENLGIAFQIKDDLLSLTKSEDEIEKPGEIDIREKIVTLPIIYAIKNGTEEDKESIRRIFSSAPSASDCKIAIDILNRSGAVERAEEFAFHYSKKAKKALDIIPQSPSKKMLIELADFVVERPF